MKLKLALCAPTKLSHVLYLLCTLLPIKLLHFGKFVNRILANKIKKFYFKLWMCSVASTQCLSKSSVKTPLLLSVSSNAAECFTLSNKNIEFQQKKL